MQEYIGAIEKPHSKKQMPTPIGRLIDDASYLTTVLFFLEILLLSAEYIYLASNYWAGNGIAPTTDTIASKSIDFIDALYFCVITFTSTGYGDYAPQGFARVTASIVVLFGLAMVTILIGKAATERQNSTLLLLYTSDCQRRLAEFCQDLKSAVDDLISANENRNWFDVKNSSRKIANTLEQISRYTLFHANQGKLTIFGNDSALSALYEALFYTQRACANTFFSLHGEKEIGRRAFAIVERTARYARVLVQIQKNAQEKKYPFQSFVPAKLSDGLKSYFLVEQAQEGRDAKTIRSMAELEGKVGDFAKKKKVEYLERPSKLSANVLAILEFSPDASRLTAELENMQVFTGRMSPETAEAYNGYLIGFTNVLAKTRKKMEQELYKNGDVTGYCRALSQFEFEIRAWIAKLPAYQARFPLLASDPRMLVLQWLLHIKRVQICLEMSCAVFALSEASLGSIRNTDAILSEFALTLIADIRRSSLRKAVLRLQNPKRHRTTIRDIALQACWREIKCGSQRIKIVSATSRT